MAPGVSEKATYRCLPRLFLLRFIHDQHHKHWNYFPQQQDVPLQPTSLPFCSFVPHIITQSLQQHVQRVLIMDFYSSEQPLEGTTLCAEGEEIHSKYISPEQPER